MLYPKPLYMIEILNTRKENQAWLKIYKYMQYRYHISFLLGLIFAYFLYKSLVSLKEKAQGIDIREGGSTGSGESE